MTLHEYLNICGIKIGDFANLTKIPLSSLYRIWKGERDPSYHRGKTIEAATGGQVTWEKI